jgi:hypothetical protein
MDIIPLTEENKPYYKIMAEELNVKNIVIKGKKFKATYNLKNNEYIYEKN